MNALLGFACAVMAFIAFIGAYGMGIEAEREVSPGKAAFGFCLGIFGGAAALWLAYLAGRWS